VLLLCVYGDHHTAGELVAFSLFFRLLLFVTLSCEFTFVFTQGLFICSVLSVGPPVVFLIVAVSLPLPVTVLFFVGSQPPLLTTAV